MIKIGILASSLLKNVFDSFTRTTTGQLGVSTSGALWTALRGTWYADGAQAKSDDAAANYSIASVAIGTDTTTSADVSGGVGVAFWISDAGSWWAAVPYYTQTTNSNCTNGLCSGTENYQYQATTCSNGTCGPTETVYPSNCPTGQCSGTYTGSIACSCTYATRTCNCDQVSTLCQYGIGANLTSAKQCASLGGRYSSANGGTCCFDEPYSNCDSGACSGTELYVTSSTCSNMACSGYESYTISCSCSPTVVSCGCYLATGTRSCSCTYTQSYFLRLLRSVGGTVSTATSDISLPSAAAAVKVITAGNSITAQAYSNSGMTTPIGNALMHTAVSPTKGPSVGLVKTPVPYSQGSTADNFSSGA